MGTKVEELVRYPGTNTEKGNACWHLGAGPPPVLRAMWEGTGWERLGEALHHSWRTELPLASYSHCGKCPQTGGLR
jgi:hypothetical protein